MMLDLESVRQFVLTVEFESLTRAAEAAGTAQPVVSQRLKALEAALGCKLLDRSPRYVRTTSEGANFLPKARALLAAHDDAVRVSADLPLSVSIGISDQVMGVGLERLLRQLHGLLPTNAVISVRIGLSQNLHAAFDDGQLDAVVIRRDLAGSGGEILGHDPLGWRLSPNIAPAQGKALPLAVLAPPCGVRALAMRTLEASGILYREGFVAGSCAALLAGVRAGLGVAPMGRLGCNELPDRGPELGLPPLPASEIVLFGRASSPAIGAAIRTLAAAVTASL